MALLNALAAKNARPEPAADAEAPKQRKPRKGHGPTPQPNLGQERRLMELDEPDKICPACGEELAALPGQFETSEMVDVVEVRYTLVTVDRQKYVCACGGCVDTAPGPERAIEGGRYSVAFAIKVAVDKFIDHMPLSRKQRAMKRHGLMVQTSALWDQTLAIAEELRPVHDALRTYILGSPVIGLDQTGWPRLEKRAKRDKKNRPWQMWCLTTPQAILQAIREDKSEESFRLLMGDYAGVVVCDALTTHAAGARGTKIVLAGCWAHVRRRFAEAEPDFPQARIVLDMIRELYDADEQAASEQDLARIRNTTSRAILKRLEEWLLSQPALKTTSLGGAIRYAVGIWPRLTRLLTNPRIPLDNNATERALRGPVVGRKNHYGSKSKLGTEVAAIFYSLIETAKLTGVDPAGYLCEAVLAARRGEVLLPHQHAAAIA
jgi:transposase